MTAAFEHPVWSAVLLLSPVAVPLVVLLSFLASREHRVAETLAPWAPVPALALALFAPTGAHAEIPWLMMGGRLELDEVGRVFLLFASLVWLIAGTYARGHLARDPRRGSFHGYHLTAMAGMLGLPVAADVPLFYLLFALMTFSAHGLIIHSRSADALRAGQTYLVLAVLGEGLLLSGVLLTAGSMDTPLLKDGSDAILRSEHTSLIVALLIGGFGVKAALLPLHVWLPLAHPVAPTPASATLSGAMIKAGLLGWLRFLPLGAPELSSWGLTMVVVGFVGAFFGVAMGLAQRAPKIVLAYSSVSQMGLMIVITGGALAWPTAAAHVPSAAAIYALHHGIAKTSLFLAVGIASRRLTPRMHMLVMLGVAVPILAMSGAPLTSGAIAKKALGGVLDAAPGTTASSLTLLASLASTATMLLMLRFAWVVRARAGRETGSISPEASVAWLVSVIATVMTIWLVPWVGAPTLAEDTLSRSELWASAWPIGLGLGLAASAVLLARRRAATMPAMPPGDILVFLEHHYARARPRLASHAEAIRTAEDRAKAGLSTRARRLAARARALLAGEQALTSWNTGVVLLVAAVCLAFALMVFSRPS